MDAQSDVVVGGNLCLDIEKDNRDICSDIADLCFIDDLFKDDKKFLKFLQKNKNKDSDEEILQMKQVRFSSLVNLPSHYESCSIDKQSGAIGISDFILLKTLNAGAYGRVILAR